MSESADENPEKWTPGAREDDWRRYPGALDADLPRHAPATTPWGRDPTPPGDGASASQDGREIPPPRVRLPVLLFVATCLSTVFMGQAFYGPAGGLLYGVAVMTILLSHELGHYLQARRYDVPASLPYFLPLPFLSPFGTLGAVIAMRPHSATGRGLYDIAISGPLAGLVPTLVFAFISLRQSSYVPTVELPDGPAMLFGEPLLLEWISGLVLGPAPPDHTLIVGAFGFAAWVGIFITALNMLPVGQLDGGHILFALTPRYAHSVSRIVFGSALVAVIAFQLWHWTLLLVLLLLLGLRHPPVVDQPPFELGLGRRLLGWLMLLFVFVGLTPNPIQFTGL